MKNHAVLSTSIILIASAVAGCNSASRADQTGTPSQPAKPEVTAAPSGSDPSSGQAETRAEADLTAATGAKLQGKATFIQEPGGVRVVLEIADAPPGKKGVHVHERGDCSDIKGQSMGPHFAPKLEQHALPAEGVTHHLGDLGNIVVTDSGKGRLEIKVVDATLGPDNGTSFLGRALVVHFGEDAGSNAQPSGDSGAPMACGVIEKT